MAHRAEKLLADMVAAGETVQAFTAGKTLEDFGQNLLLRSGVERQLEIPGEALRRRRDLDPRLAAKISEHRRIIDFRNLLAHGYDVLDEAIIWQVIVDKLPVLLSEVRRLQNSAPPSA